MGRIMGYYLEAKAPSCFCLLSLWFESREQTGKRSSDFGDLIGGWDSMWLLKSGEICRQENSKSFSILNEHSNSVKEVGYLNPIT